VEQYASGTIAQVQAIQALQMGQTRRMPNRARNLER
jgi:hypothetical protein